MSNKTVEVFTSDLLKLKEQICEHFVSEDNYSNDYCRFCNTDYGNYNLLVESKAHIYHEPDCPVLLIQDLTTRLD